jgi:hypothetical protein
MNIVTQFPVNLNLNTANPHTEAARKESAARELISQTEELERFNREKGLGHDTEQSSAKQQPLTYDYIKAQHKREHSAEDNQTQEQQAAKDDATEDQENRGKAGQEAKQQAQKAQQEEQKLQELKDRDKEVRTHEQAHASIGGQYAGSPSYEYEKGSDGNNYAVGGEVKIDVSEVKGDPEATIQKMEVVQRAALAPAEPSSQDRKVANDAAQKQQQARSELLKEQTASAKATSTTEPTPQNVASVIKAEDIAQQGIEVTKVPEFQAKQSLEFEQNDNPSYNETLAQSDARINARALKIQRHYHINSIPHQTNFSSYA